MKIKTKISYEESYLPTPRCRKLRYRDAEALVDIDLAETSMQNMQLAFEVERYDGKNKIYYYNDKLWIKATVHDFIAGRHDGMTTLDALKNAYKYFYTCNLHPNKEQVIKEVQEELDKYLLVDGEPYVQTGEPRYTIYTFGLGHNHGGTDLSCDYHYNPNISKNMYFSALQGKEAVAKANEVAAGRGDTNDVGTFKPCITCYMPEIVKVNPQVQHGDGDPFINGMESLINKSSSVTEAGLLTIAATAASINKEK